MGSTLCFLFLKKQPPSHVATLRALQSPGTIGATRMFSAWLHATSTWLPLKASCVCVCVLKGSCNLLLEAATTTRCTPLRRRHHGQILKRESDSKKTEACHNRSQQEAYSFCVFSKCLQQGARQEKTKDSNDGITFFIAEQKKNQLVTLKRPWPINLSMGDDAWGNFIFCCNTMNMKTGRSRVNCSNTHRPSGGSWHLKRCHQCMDHCIGWQ